MESTYFVDLRNRVVGARLMDLKMDPYFFKWNPDYPARLCDPVDNCNIRNNMTTSPPSLLWLMQPLSRLDFQPISRIWVVIHYLFFLIILLPIYSVTKTVYGKNFVLIMASLLLRITE